MGAMVAMKMADLFSTKHPDKSLCDEAPLTGEDKQQDKSTLKRMREEEKKLRKLREKEEQENRKREAKLQKEREKEEKEKSKKAAMVEKQKGKENEKLRARKKKSSGS